MSRHTYPLANIIGDYVRALAGLLFISIPVLVASLNAIMAVVLAALAAMSQRPSKPEASQSDRQDVS